MGGDLPLPFLDEHQGRRLHATDAAQRGVGVVDAREAAGFDAVTLSEIVREATSTQAAEARVREESLRVGTRPGVLRALAVQTPRVPIIANVDAVPKRDAAAGERIAAGAKP